MAGAVRGAFRQALDSLQTATFFVLGGTGNTSVTKVELVSCLPLPRQEHMPNT